MDRGTDRLTAGAAESAASIDAIDAIDWNAPWVAPYRDAGRWVAHHAMQSSVAEALQAGRITVQDRLPPIDLPDSEHVDPSPERRSLPVPPRFVPQAALPAGTPYEAHIFRTGEVPTRDNLHDFFNGIVWLHYPQAKRRLNELQATEIDRTGITAKRGPLRDALTLFDENGAVLDAPPQLWDALLARDWRRLFITERALWADARLLVFGHALLDKLTAPRKSLTAHVLRSTSGCGAIRIDDESIVAALDPAHLATKPFTPLPVLGIPGWSEGNSDFRFYDDSDIFRPLRAREAKTTERPAGSKQA